MQKEWQVINHSPIRNSVIEQWLNAINIRNFFEVTIATYDTVETVCYDWNGWGRWVFPVRPYTIIISYMNDPEYPKPADCKYRGGTLDTRCSVVFVGDETPQIMGARIFHELLHAAGADSDQMNGTDRKAFFCWNPGTMTFRQRLNKLLWALKIVTGSRYTDVELHYYEYLSERLNVTGK